MQATSRPSGARATSWLSGPVKRARIRLTGVYLALLAVVFVVMGLSTRYIFEQRVERRFVPRQPIVAQLENGDLAIIRPRPEDLQKDLLDTLLVVNLTTFFGSAVLAYILAGLTLRPIQKAAERERLFIRHASHELRTPLAILRAELENAGLDAAQEEGSRIASYLEEVDRLQALTNDLLGQRQDQPWEEINLPAFAQKEQERVADLAKAHGVTLLPVQASANILLKTIPVRLSVVLQNLLQNAIRYNKPGGTVQMTLTQQKKKVIIAIKDTGLGIPEKDLPFVTDRFYRVQRVQPSGTGLGLSIAKEGIEELGGTLDMKSVEGEGTEVTVML
jgi:two-component system sensor histidine kinase CiaH